MDDPLGQWALLVGTAVTQGKDFIVRGAEHRHIAFFRLDDPRTQFRDIFKLSDINPVRHSIHLSIPDTVWGVRREIKKIRLMPQISTDFFQGDKLMLIHTLAGALGPRILLHILL